MDIDVNTASALISALRLAREHGGAGAALRATGVDLRDVERVHAVSQELARTLDASGRDSTAGEALALGLLAGRVAQRPRKRPAGDPTSFVMDRDLLVRGAEGESILRLPWFEDELFVGRQLPDIYEMPTHIRKLCITTYSAALAGERGHFSFTSYGHSYAVEALPVHGTDSHVEAVLAIATPTRPYPAAADAYERTAGRLDRSGDRAEQRAELHRLAGRPDAEHAERKKAEKARRAAARARTSAMRLRSQGPTGEPTNEPALSSREAEVLQLASHGLSYLEIADQLAVSGATVRTHLSNIYSKLEVADKAAAVAAALRCGLID